jgi:hypothetical protein
MYSPERSSAPAAPRTIPPCQAAPPWAELTAIVTAALQVGGCCGWSLGVYNTDLDPDRHAAQQIVNFLAEVIGTGR